MPPSVPVYRQAPRGPFPPPPPPSHRRRYTSTTMDTQHILGKRCYTWYVPSRASIFNAAQNESTRPLRPLSTGACFRSLLGKRNADTEIFIDGALFWQLQYSAIDDSNVVSINAQTNLNSTGKGTVMIATGNTQGSPYLTLNQSQCSVSFIPTLFDISVNLSSLVITVHRANDASDMDPTAQPNATFTAWRCHTLPNALASLDNSTSGCGNYTKDNLD